MSGFGTELLLFCGLGYMVLGPKRMQELVVRIARAKKELEKTRQEITSQLATDLDGDPKDTSS